MTEKANNDYELHLFCDASEQAMAACIYIVSSERYGSTRSLALCEDQARPA